MILVLQSAFPVWLISNNANAITIFLTKTKLTAAFHYLSADCRYLHSKDNDVIDCDAC